MGRPKVIITVQWEHALREVCQAVIEKHGLASQTTQLKLDMHSGHTSASLDSGSNIL